MVGEPRELTLVYFVPCVELVVSDQVCQFLEGPNDEYLVGYLILSFYEGPEVHDKAGDNSVEVL